MAWPWFSNSCTAPLRKARARATDSRQPVRSFNLLKHAPSVPQCALAFVALFKDAGAPDGAYTNLFLSNDKADRLIDEPRIKGIAVTGGERAGSAVAAQAGKNLKKSTMELGGSDAFIVLEDAELDKTVKWAVWGRMNNTGQCCVAAKRFIGSAQEFVGRAGIAELGLNSQFADG